MRHLVVAVVLVGASVAAGRVVWALARAPLGRLGGPGGCVASGSPGCAGPDLESLVAGLCAAALLGCLAWLLTVTTLAVVAAVADAAHPRSARTARLRRAADRSCPAVLRRLVAVALGVALTAGTLHPADADEPGHESGRPSGHTSGHMSGPTSGQSPSPGESVDQRLAGLSLPDRPTGDLTTGDPTTGPDAPAQGGIAGPAAVARPVALSPHQAGEGTTHSVTTREHHEARADEVVVRPGDSLWSITARLLGPRVTDASVSRGWHLLQQRNAGVLGADPDLIVPGTRLAVPEPLALVEKESR